MPGSAARRTLDIARNMANAERVNFANGNSDMFRVNIRVEQSAATAAFEVDPLVRYFPASMDDRAAISLDAMPKTRLAQKDS